MAGAGFGAADDDGTWGFKATPDGKVILGNTSDDVIQVTGSMDVNGGIYASEYIYHGGDTDTYIRLQPDMITIFAGSKSFIKMEEASQDKLVFNNGANDIDFHIKGKDNANLFRTIADANQIGIGTNDPDHLLDVNGVANATTLSIGGTSIGSTATELNMLDATSTSPSDAPFAATVRIAKANFTAAADGAVGINGLGVTLPDNAIIYGGYLDITTGFEGADPAQMGFVTFGTSTYTFYPDAPIAPGGPFETAVVYKIWTDGQSISGQSAIPFKLNGGQEITAVVDDAAVTAGAADIYIQYFIGS